MKKSDLKETIKEVIKEEKLNETLTDNELKFIALKLKNVFMNSKTAKEAARSVASVLGVVFDSFAQIEDKFSEQEFNRQLKSIL